MNTLPVCFSGGQPHVRHEIEHGDYTASIGHRKFNSFYIEKLIFLSWLFYHTARY